MTNWGLTDWEWALYDDPDEMMHFACRDWVVTGAETTAGEYWNRKERLILCAAARTAWHRLTMPCWRRAVLVAERFADGLATSQERYDACNAVQDTYEPLSWDNNRLSLALLSGAPVMSDLRFNTNRLARAGCLRGIQVNLIHEILGPPHAPAPILGTPPPPPPRGGGVVERPYWLTDQVTSLAQAAYDYRGASCKRCHGDDHSCPRCLGCGEEGDGRLDPFRLNVLADCLEDAGCREATLLYHLRGQEWCLDCQTTAGRYAFRVESSPEGEWLPCPTCRGTGLSDLPVAHYRGCWAVDHLLGRGILCRRP